MSRAIRSRFKQLQCELGSPAAWQQPREDGGARAPPLRPPHPNACRENLRVLLELSVYDHSVMIFGYAYQPSSG